MTDLPAREVEALRAFAEQLADAARAVITPYFRKPLAIDDKPTDSPTGQPVTRADREAEEKIRELIRRRYPDHGILGEELGAENPEAELCWVLDPIDGTRAFIAGLPLFGTLIGLGFRGRPVLGVLDQPVMGERFVGTKRGSSLNGRTIRARPCAKPSAAVYAITDPRMMETPAQRAVHERLMRETHFCQFGGNCYAYAMLAAGAIDLVTEGNLKPWDVFALVPIVEGAGGVITGWDGGPAAESALVVACGDAALHAALLPLLKGAA